MNGKLIVVAVVVLLAAGVLAWKLYARFTGKAGSSCPTCGRCPKGKRHDDPKT